MSRLLDRLMHTLLFGGMDWTDANQGKTFIAAWAVVIIGLIAAYPT